MIYFTSDYTEGCHSRILDRMIQTNFEQTSGYGTDYHCQNAVHSSHLTVKGKFA